MSFQPLNFLLQLAEETQNKNIPKKSDKIDLQSPFGLNDLMFDENELHSCDYNITSPMSLLHLESQPTDECSNISDYITKHLSLLSTEESKLSIKHIEPKLPVDSKINNENCVNNINYEDNISYKPLVDNQGNFTKKYKIVRTKSLANVRKSPLEKPDSGLSLTIGRKYPRSNSNLMNNYLCNVLVETRSRGFKFNTPSPDELVLSWMDIVRQMPNK